MTHRTESLPIIQGMAIDLEAIRSIRHACRPALCREMGGCCGQYEIAVDARELPSLVGFLPQAAEFAPHLKTRDGYLNVFDEERPRYVVIDPMEDGLCSFAYRTSDGAAWCSLHSAAVKRGLSPARVKPLCCTLWPLSLEQRPRRTLTVHPEALSFPCNEYQAPAANSLDSGIAEIIRAVWGDRFLQRLMRLADGPGPSGRD